MSLPGVDEATSVASKYLGFDVSRVERLTTGLCHRVFLVTSQDGERVVVRMATPSSREDLAGGVYWAPRLRALGVPTPKILALAIDYEPPSVLLEYLDGRDLGDVYANMTAVMRTQVASQIASYQTIVAEHFEAPQQRFGYLTTPDKTHALDHSWGALIERLFLRSRARLESTRLLSPGFLDAFSKLFEELRADLDALEPRAFLHDTTTKNVLIGDDGSLRGIVDTDSLCFGDPILPMALTHVSLTYRGLACEEDYILPWFEGMGFSKEDRWRLDFYRGLVAIDFISEFGQTFNSEQPLAIDHDRVALLKGIADEVSSRNREPRSR